MTTIRLKGVRNARDLGGMPIEGGVLADGMLLRSAHLNTATDGDIDILCDNHCLSLIIDLRTRGERDERPDPALYGVHYKPLPLFDRATRGITHEHEDDEEPSQADEVMRRDPNPGDDRLRKQSQQNQDKIEGWGQGQGQGRGQDQDDDLGIDRGWGPNRGKGNGWDDGRSDGRSGGQDQNQDGSRSGDLAASLSIPAMPRLYAAMVTEPLVGNLGQVVHAVLEHDFERGSVLFHCSEGKDRTGIVAMALLQILGSPADQIERDYLLTNEVNAKRARRQYMATLLRTRDRARAEGARASYIADATYLTAAYRAIEQAYGSMDAFIRDALGVSDERRREFQRRMRA